MFKFVLISLLLAFLYIAEGTNEVGCSYKERRHGLISLSIPRETIVTVYIDCVLDHETPIASPDTKFSNEKNETVTNLIATENKHIEYLPQDISDVFPNLKEIRVEDTLLRAITKKNFHGLDKLFRLALDRNEISSIAEDSFDDLAKIYTIQLSNNKLTSLPAKVFSKLSTLDTLHLDENQISSLDADIFKHNKNLALLFLNGNKISTFDPHTFSSQTKMRQIWLHKNEIATLNSEWFKTCVSLVDINLSDNKICEIPLDFIATLSSLSEISISRSPITAIDFKLFENNPNIYMIHFNGLKLKKVLNVDFVDKLTNVRGLYFDEENDACLTGEFHEGNLDVLKEIVKKNCQVE